MYIASKSIEYQTKLIGSTPNDNNILDAEVVVPLKYLSNFCVSLDLPLINYDVELDLRWSKNCIISEISGTLEVGKYNPAEAILTTSETFQITTPNFMSLQLLCL